MIEKNETVQDDNLKSIFRHTATNGAILYAKRFGKSEDYFLSSSNKPDAHGWWYCKDHLVELREFLNFLIEELDSPNKHGEWVKVR